MRWSLDDEQEMLADALTDWLDQEASSESVRSMLTAGDPAPFENSLTEGGWLGLGVSEDQDGQGGGLTELCLLAEALAAHAAPASAWLATVLALPALPAGDELRTRVLSEGGHLALVVPAHRPPDESGTIRSDGNALTGDVSLVLGADRASALIVPAIDETGTLGIWVVETGAAGLTIEPVPLLDGSRSAARVKLDGAPARLLDIDSAAYLADAASRAAVLVAADALGAAGRMRKLAVEYSTQRSQFGKPIGAFQAVKHAAATMLVNEEAARSLVYYAAATVDAGADQSSLHAAAAKAQTCESAAHAADSALTLHGAIGYTWEHDLQLYYKRGKLDLELFGAPSVWNERIAQGLELS